MGRDARFTPTGEGRAPPTTERGAYSSRSVARGLLDTLRMKHLLSSFAFSVLVTACTTSGGSDLEFAQRAAEVEGIYRVESHLMNEAACAPGGSPMEDMHGFAFAKRGSVFGVDYLQIYSCESVADCRAKAAQAQFSGLIDFSFTLSAVDGDLLIGTMSTSGYSDGGTTCSMPEMQELELALDGDALRIEGGIHKGHDYTTTDGICWTDKGREASEDAPCSQMETLTATFVEAL